MMHTIRIIIYITLSLYLSPLHASRPDDDQAIFSRYSKVIEEGKQANKNFHAKLLEFSDAHPDWISPVIKELCLLEKGGLFTDRNRWKIVKRRKLIRSPQAIIHSAPKALVQDLINVKDLSAVHPGFLPLTNVMSALKSLSALLPQSFDQKNLQQLLQYYTEFKKSLQQADPDMRKELLREEVRMSTVVGDYYIPPYKFYAMLGGIDKTELVGQGTKDERFVLNNPLSNYKYDSAIHTCLKTDQDYAISFSLDHEDFPLGNIFCYWFGRLWDNINTSPLTILHFKDVEVLENGESIRRYFVIKATEAVQGGTSLNQDSKINKDSFFQDTIAQVLFSPNRETQKRIFVDEQGRINRPNNSPLGIKNTMPSQKKSLLESKNSLRYLNCINTLFCHPIMKKIFFTSSIPSHHPLEFMIQLLTLANQESEDMEALFTRCGLMDKQHFYHSNSFANVMGLPLEMRSWYPENMLKVLVKTQKLKCQNKQLSLQEIVVELHPLIGSHYAKIADEYKNDLGQCENAITLNSRPLEPTGDEQWSMLSSYSSNYTCPPQGGVLQMLGNWQDLDKWKTEKNESFNRILAHVAINFPPIDLKLINNFEPHSKQLKYIIQNNPNKEVRKFAWLFQQKNNFLHCKLTPACIELIEEPLAELQDLVSLSIRDIPMILVPFSNLAKFVNLTHLKIIASGLNTGGDGTDFSVFTKLEALELLDLSDNQINKLAQLVSALQNLKKLKTLILDKNPIYDIRPVVQLKQLETLSLVDVPITDLGFVRYHLKNLKKLEYSGCYVPDGYEDIFETLKERIIKSLGVEASPVCAARNLLEQCKQSATADQKEAIDNLLQVLKQPAELFQDALNSTENGQENSNTLFQVCQQISEVFIAAQSKLIQHSNYEAIKQLLQSVDTYYTKLSDKLTQAQTPEEKMQLLHPQYIKFVNDPNFYYVSSEMIADFTSLIYNNDEKSFGVINKKEGGKHAVTRFNGYYSKLDICPIVREGCEKKVFFLQQMQDDQDTISPGRQDAESLFWELLLGGSTVVHSAYLTLEVQIHLSNEKYLSNKEYYVVNEKVIDYHGLNSTITNQYNEEPDKFPLTNVQIGTSVSQAVQGITLNEFLRDVLNDKRSIEDLDLTSFQKFGVPALFAGPWDFKGDNFIVDKEGKIWLVDTNSAFAPSINCLGPNEGHSHSVNMRNILLLFTPLMQQKIQPEVKEIMQKPNPTNFLLYWLGMLYRQNKKYQEHEESQVDSTSRLAKFPNGIISSTHDNFYKTQGRMKTEATLEDIFPLLHPEVQAVYLQILNENKDQDDPSKPQYLAAFKHIYDEALSVHPVTIEDRLSKSLNREEFHARVQHQQGNPLFDLPEDAALKIINDAFNKYRDRLEKKDFIFMWSIMGQYLWDPLVEKYIKGSKEGGWGWHGYKEPTGCLLHLKCLENRFDDIHFLYLLTNNCASLTARKLAFVASHPFLADFRIQPKNIDLHSKSDTIPGFLKTLDFSGKTILDVTPFTIFSMLTTLKLSGCGLKNDNAMYISKIANFCYLIDLDVSHNGLSSLKFLDGLSCLQKLNISDNQFGDNSGTGVFFYLTNLKWIDASNNLFKHSAWMPNNLKGPKLDSKEQNSK